MCSTREISINYVSPPEDMLNSDFHSDFEPESTDESIPEDGRYMADPCICLPPIDELLPLGMEFLHKVKQNSIMAMQKRSSTITLANLSIIDGQFSTAANLMSSIMR